MLVVEHLAGCRGGGVEDPVVVDGHYVVESLLGVFESGLEVVDSRGSNEPVQTLLFGGNRCEGIVDFGVVADVDFDVVQVAAVILGFVLGLEEVRMRCLETV